ncbi:MAG: hypothetical protein HGA37_17850, partial [Lentimicrobium sp.]|nr:hypothetical protein [Lentimicrobium sp.]
QQLDILGNAIPNVDKTPEIDWNGPGDLSFYFDLGLTPKFELSLDGKVGVVYHKIEVSDEIAAKYLDDMRRRNGELTEVEVSEKGDLLKGDFAELDADGNVKEEGITSNGTVNPELFKDEAIVALFTGKKVGEVVRFNPMQASGNATDVAAMLGIAKDVAENLNAEFNFSVSSVSHMVPAELNAEFFEKIYPGTEISTEAELLEQIKKDAAGSFVSESDKKFFNDAVKAVMDKAAIQLPEEFLKRWLVEVNQDKLSAEEVELHFNEYANSMRWQLIENRLIREHGISVQEEEIKDVFRNYFRRPGSSEMDDDTKMRIDSIVDSFMKNKEDVRRINDQIFEQKLLVLLKEKLEPKETSVSYEEFAKLASEK